MLSAGRLVWTDGTPVILILSTQYLTVFVRLLPPGLMDEHRRTAAAAAERPRSATGAVIVILAWIAAAAFTAWLLAWAYY